MRQILAQRNICCVLALAKHHATMTMQEEEVKRVGEEERKQIEANNNATHCSGIHTQTWLWQCSLHLPLPLPSSIHSSTIH